MTSPTTTSLIVMLFSPGEEKVILNGVDVAGRDGRLIRKTPS